jgi:hypothetical protein
MAGDVQQAYLTKDVFVAGATPSITYNPRDDRHLEKEMSGYLEQGPGRALTVSGPTKSGKTVLVERSLPQDEAIWMEGPDLRSVDDSGIASSIGLACMTLWRFHGSKPRDRGGT